jgi:uncharacterized protein
MKSTLGRSEAAPEVPSPEPRRRVDGRLVVLLVIIALYSREMLSGSLNPVALRTWTTVFVAIVAQALPFLVLGVLVSGPSRRWCRRRCWSGCCRSRRSWPCRARPSRGGPARVRVRLVPIAGRLTARGVQPAAAVAFMLAAPAVNPVVLVATAVPFSQRPA